MNHFAGWCLFVVLFMVTSCGSVDLEVSESNTAVPPLATPEVALAPVTPAPTAEIIESGLATAVPSNTPTTDPTSTPMPTSTPTATSTITPTPVLLPWTESYILGYSALSEAIEVVQIGQGANPFVIIGAIHGGHECNTRDLVQGIISRLTTEPNLFPPDVTLYAIPVVNPDGCAAGTRTNAHQVDLNRNWDTLNWLADAEGPGGIRTGSGGQAPFSEPETILVRDWLIGLNNQYPEKQIQVISYHSVVPNTGLVQPGYSQPGQPNPAAMALAHTYAAVTGYLYSSTWVGNYTITGEFINWANDHGLIVWDVELPDRNGADTIPVGWSKTHIETNLQGLLAIMAVRP